MVDEVMLPEVPVTVTWYVPVVVDAEELMVSVDVRPAAPVIATDVGLRFAAPQVSGLAAAAGADVTAQEILTVPVNPPEGVTPMMEVLPVVAA